MAVNVGDGSRMISNGLDFIDNLSIGVSIPWIVVVDLYNMISDDNRASSRQTLYNSEGASTVVIEDGNISNNRVSDPWTAFSASEESQMAIRDTIVQDNTNVAVREKSQSQLPSTTSYIVPHNAPFA